MTLTLRQLEINTRLWHIQGACEPDGDFPRIIAFRNFLVHNYPHVEHDAVWVIVQTDLPILLARVRELLASAEGSPAEPA